MPPCFRVADYRDPLRDSGRNGLKPVRLVLALENFIWSYVAVREQSGGFEKMPKTAHRAIFRPLFGRSGGQKRYALAVATNFRRGLIASWLLIVQRSL